MGAKSTPSAPTTTTQQTNMGPWQAQQPYLTKGFEEAQKLYDNYDPKYYQGNAVAGLNDAQKQGYGQITGMGSTVNPILDAQNRTATDTISGKYLDPNTNPFLAATYGQAADQVTRSYQTATDPSTQAAFSGAGRYGSGARNQQVSQNQQDLGKSLGNLGTSIYGGNYQQERDRQLAATNNAGNYAQANYIPANNQVAAGGALQQQNQNEINADMAKWNYDQNLPYQKLNSYLASVGGNYGQSGTTTGTQTGNTYSNPTGQAVGGVASLASVLGPLMMKSDRRAKVGIKRIGMTFDGQPLYLFRYADDPTRLHVGLMAQDVEKIDPGAVVEIEGVKHVNYERALSKAVALGMEAA